MNQTREHLFWEQLKSERHKEDQSVVAEIIKWANMKGIGDYPPIQGTYYSYLVKTKRPILRIWAKNSGGAGDIEIYFINHHKTFLFDDQSTRQQFLDMILKITTIETFRKPLTINNRRNIKFSSFHNRDSLRMFLNTIEWAVNQMEHYSEVMALHLEEQCITLQETQEEERLMKAEIPETEKEQLVKARRGQGRFRLRVEEIESACRLTHTADKRFLVASHIKPWRLSDNVEKLDGNNGLLLAPHVDRLFDRGWISFSDDGAILYVDAGIKSLMMQWGLAPESNVGYFNEKQRQYLAFHRTNVYRA